MGISVNNPSRGLGREVEVTVTVTVIALRAPEIHRFDSLQMYLRIINVRANGGEDGASVSVRG